MAEKKGTAGTTRDKLPEKWLRRTFIMHEKHSDLLDRAAYWEREYVKDILYDALEGYFAKKNLKPLPKDRSRG